MLDQAFCGIGRLVGMAAIAAIAACSLDSAGLALAQPGRFESGQASRGAVESKSRTWGTSQLQAARSLEERARALHSQGRHEEALPLYEEALSIYEGQPSPDDLRIASLLNNLAALRRALAASSAEARKRDALFSQSEADYRRSLQIKRRALGAGDPSVALTLNNLAFLYQQQERWQEAADAYRQSVSILEGKPGSDPAELRRARGSLGAVLRTQADLLRGQGDYARAEALYFESKAIFEGASDNPQLAVTLTSLASLYRLRGWDSEAAQLDRRALAVLETETQTESMVSLFDWTLRSTYGSSLIQQLPLGGFRTFDQLALLSPGVFRIPFDRGRGPAVGLGVGATGQFAVNGFRSRSNNFTVDGSDNNDEDIGMRRQGFVSLIPQTIDSIENFQIQTAGFLSEFGRNAGSMVNAVSRSGRRDLHGALYGLFSDDALNSRNFFDRPFNDRVNSGDLSGGSFTGEDFRQTQIGGVFGGELAPSTFFYFFSYEYQRSRGTSLGHFAVPLPSERGLRINPNLVDLDGDGQRDGFVPIDELGDFFEGFVPYSSLAGQGVLGLFPLPNNPQGPFGEHTYSQAKPDQGGGHIFSGKLDWELGAIHTFTARYNFTDDQSIIPFTGDAIHSSLGTDTRTQNLSTYLATSATGFSNTVRFSYGRTRLAFPPERSSPLLFGSPLTQEFLDSFSEDQQELLAQPIDTPLGRFGPFGASGPVGQLTVSPYSTIGIDVFNFPQGRVDNTFQIAENFLRIGRSHNLQFGFDFRFSQLNSFADRNFRPAYVFGPGIVGSDCAQNPRCPFRTDDNLLRGTDLAALGVAGGVLQTLSTGAAPDSAIGLRFGQFDFFVQDSWRLRPNLTLNLGLRYELQTVPREQNGRIEATFGLTAADFSKLDENDFQGEDRAAVGVGNAAFDAALQGWNSFLADRERIYSADRNNWAPRIGFAWDPFGKGRTAVRAGYGIYYDANLGAVTSQSRNVFPTFIPLNLDPNFFFDAGAPPAGRFLNSVLFLQFRPTGQRYVRPGTLNSYNLSGDAFATALGTLFAQSIPGENLSSNSVAFTLPEKSLESSYGQHWLLSLQQQLGGQVIALNYVGTRGLRLTRFATPNLGLVSTPVLLFSVDTPFRILDLPPGSSAGGFGRPRSGLGAFTVFENSASSSYHSLQVSLHKRLGGRLSYRTHWTWSHTVDEVSDPFDGRGFFALAQDSSRLDLERGPANFDVRHRWVSLLRWDLPDSRLGGAFKGWTVAALGEFQSGQPYTVNTSFDRNLDGNLTDRLNSVAGLQVRPGDQRAIRIDPSIDPLTLIADLGASGRVGRNSFRADDLALLDVSLSRRFSFRNETALDLRLEVFNVLNNTSFGIPVRILESPAFGRSFDTQSMARSLRLGLKLSF